MPFQGLPWTEFISCPVCSKVFNEQQQRPISLGCGHTVCKSCIRSKLNDNRCPFDQTSLPSEVDKLPANFALMHLVGAAVPEQEKKATFTVSDNPKSYEQARKCIEDMAEHLKPLADSNSDDDSSTCSDPVCSSDKNDVTSTNKVLANSNITPRCVLSRPMQRKLISLIHCQLLEEEGRSRSARIARSLGDRIVSECLILHQYPHQLSANLWAAVRTRGCQFLGPAMQEEVLKLILMALEDGSFLSRKNLVLFVVQRMEERYPQASKTAIGHVVQLLYRASCFKVLKREEKSSLMQLKEEFRQYDLLCREHDTQMLQIASEAGLRISPEQWSSLLYGDTSHKSHMQSIIDKHQTPQSFAQSISELMSTLQKSGDPCCLRKLQPQLEFLSNIDPSPDCPAPSWENLEAIMRSLNTVMTAFVEFLSSPDYRSRQEVAPTQNVRYKTSMCRDFSAQGTCPRGNTCTFAHSQDELERYRSRSRRGGSNVDLGYADKKFSRVGAIKPTQVPQISLLSNKESHPKPGTVATMVKEGPVETAKGSGNLNGVGNGSIPLSLSGSSCVSSAPPHWRPQLDVPSYTSGGQAPLKQQRQGMNRMNLAGPARPAMRPMKQEQPAFVCPRAPHPSMQLTFSNNSQAVDALDDGHHPSKAHLMKFYPSTSMPLMQGSLQQNHVSNSPHFPRSNPCGTATGFPTPQQCGVSSPQVGFHPTPFYPPPVQNSACHNFDDWTSRLQHIPPPVIYPVTKRDEIPPATGGAAVAGHGLYPHGALVYQMQAEETLEDLTSRKLELISHLQEPMFMHPMASVYEVNSTSHLMQPLDGLKTVLADNKQNRWGMPKHVSDMFVATRSTQSLDDLIQDDLPRYPTQWSTGEDIQLPDCDKSKAKMTHSDACLNPTAANIQSNHACSDMPGNSTVSGSLLYNFPSSRAMNDEPHIVDISSFSDPEFSRFPGDDGDDLFIPFEHSSVSRFGPISRMAKAKVDNIAPVQVTADSSKKLTPVLAVTPQERPVTSSMLMSSQSTHSGSGEFLSAEPAVKPTPTEAPSIWQHSPQPSHHNIAWLKAGAAEAFTNNERLAYELQAVELEISMKTGRKPKPVGKIISEAVMGMSGPQVSVGAHHGYSSSGACATCISGQVSRTYGGSVLGHGHVTECLTNIIPSHRAAQNVLEDYEMSWLGMNK